MGAAQYPIGPIAQVPLSVPVAPWVMKQASGAIDIRSQSPRASPQDFPGGVLGSMLSVLARQWQAGPALIGTYDLCYASALQGKKEISLSETVTIVLNSS